MEETEKTNNPAWAIITWTFILSMGYAIVRYHVLGEVTGIIDYYFKPEAKMKSMRISLTYYYGLIDILKDNPGDAWNNSILMLSLAIPMGGGDDVDEIEK
jgi:hypothetical protein